MYFTIIFLKVWLGFSHTESQFCFICYNTMWASFLKDKGVSNKMQSWRQKVQAREEIGGIKNQSIILDLVTDSLQVEDKYSNTTLTFGPMVLGE